MRRRALACLLLLALAPAARAADEGVVERPALKPGDSWKYRHSRSGPNVKNPGQRVYEFRITFVGPKAVTAVQTMPSGKEIDTTWTPEWNIVTDFRSGSFFPDSGVFRFPLRPGTAYASTYEVVRPRNDTFDAKNSLAVTVVGWESVTVPAGTFRALKVEATGTATRQDRSHKRGPNSGTLHFVYWYVPELKRWAKMTFEGVDRFGRPGAQESEELLSYRVQ
jgi:hypothetical protein